MIWKKCLLKVWSVFICLPFEYLCVLGNESSYFVTGTYLIFNRSAITWIILPGWVLKFSEFCDKQKRVESTDKHLVYYRKRDRKYCFWTLRSSVVGSRLIWVGKRGTKLNTYCIWANVGGLGQELSGYRGIWDSSKHVFDDGGESRKSFSVSSTCLNDLNYIVCIYCTVWYKTQFLYHNKYVISPL